MATRVSPGTTSTSSAGFEAAREELAFAYANVPFFHGHMAQAGLAPDDVRTPDDFRRVPPTRKADFRRHFPARVLARGRSLQGRFVQRSQSSGTSGDRLVTVAPSYLLAARMHATTDVHPGIQSFLLARPQRRTCRYAAPNCSDVECATPLSTPHDRTLPDGTLVLPVLADLFATPDAMIAQALDELTAFQPHWLYADPTHLALLARHLARRAAPRPPIGAIVLTYSRSTAVARRQIRTVFPAVPLAEVLSMSEFGWLGMECPHGALHLNTRSYYSELLVGDRAAAPGELAELVVTSLGDRLSPHIRYRTGDYYTLDPQPCACGHAFPVVHHEGRWQDLVRRDGRVVLSSRTLDALVGSAPWADVYQLHQGAEDRFTFRYVPSDAPAAEHVARLATALRATLGPDARIELEAVAYLPSERSGKFATCTSSVPAPPERADA